VPFPDHINEKILSTLARFSDTTSSTLATLSPVTAPISRFLTILFPESMDLLTALPARTSAFLAKDSDFASVGPYVLDWTTQQYKCWISQYITFFLILSLQLVNLFWFFLILRILWRLVASWGETVEDVRSEDDEEEVDERRGMLEELRIEQKGDAWNGETGANLAVAPKVLINGVEEKDMQ